MFSVTCHFPLDLNVDTCPWMVTMIPLEHSMTVYRGMTREITTRALRKNKKISGPLRQI